MSSKPPAHISYQILNVTCPRCNHEFALAWHEYHKHEEHRTWTSEVDCANFDKCGYHKKVTSDRTPHDGMRKVLKAYLADEDNGEEDG